MDLVDRHALIGEVQDLVVHIGIEVTLAAQHLLDALVAPARPMVRGEHHLGLQAEAVERLVDVLRPAQGVAHRRTAQGVDVVQRGDDVLRHPERLQLGDIGVHLSRRFGVRRVLEIIRTPSTSISSIVLLHDIAWAQSARSHRRRRAWPRPWPT